MSLNNILQIGLTGMFAAGASMQTTSHNIANAATPGFSRQRALSGSTPGVLTAYGLLGSGTQIVDVSRQTDNFLVAQRRDQSSLLAQYDSENLALSNVEMIFGSVENNHLGDAMTQFFTAWSTLATPSHDPVLREEVLGSAERLVLDLNAMDANLMNLAQDLDDQIVAGVGQMNQLLTAVGDYNRQIVAAESSGTPANDLRDHRDALLSELTELARVDIEERSDGTLDVILSGRTLVTRDHVEHLEVSVAPGEDLEPGRVEISVKNGRFDVNLGDGLIKGLMIARDEQVLGARAQLDELVGTLVDRVNALHAEGLSDGGRGLMFFTGSTAADIAVNARLVDNPSHIATSRSNLSGDADIALEIAALGQGDTDVADGMSMTELFTAIVVDLAAESSASGYRVEGQQQLVDALDMRLESVRGVSLDEEAANLALYQNAYNANARVIAMAQDMFDSILNMV